LHKARKAWDNRFHKALHALKKKAAHAKISHKEYKQLVKKMEGKKIVF